MEYRVLGPLEVVADGRSVPLGPPKQRAVIGALLLHPNEVVSTERLVDELWGERPPASAGKVLQGYVSQLRKALDEAGAPHVIVTRPPGYLASVGDDELDAARFERHVEHARVLAEAHDFKRAAAAYDRALALWRGAALAGVPFESFARSESDRLEELRIATLGERVDCALAVYQDARRRLVDELGIEPSSELRELEQAILRQDERLLQAAGATAPARTQLHSRSRRLRFPWVAAAVLAAVGVTAGVVVLVRQGPSSPLLDPGTVGMIRPTTNRIGPEVATGIRPAFLAAADGALWIAGPEGTVSRVDTRRRSIAGTVAIGSRASGLVADAATAWLGTQAQQLVGIDTATLAVRIRVRLPAASLRAAILGKTAPAIALGDGFVWVSSGENAVRKMDAGTGRVVAVIVPPRGANEAIAYGDHALWLGGPNAVSRISPDTDTVTSTLRLEATPVALAVADGSLWIALGTGGEILRVDTATEAIAAVIPLGNQPTAVVAGPSGIWVASAAAGTVYRIDPLQNKIVARIRTGAAPTSLAATHQGVWVGVT